MWPMFLRRRLANDGARQGLFLVSPRAGGRICATSFAEEFKLPKDTQSIECANAYVWLIGRTKTTVRRYDAVHKIRLAIRSPFFPIWQSAQVRLNSSRTKRRYEDAAKRSRSIPCRWCVFRLCSGIAQVHPPHVTDAADPRADEEDWYRTRQVLRYRQLDLAVQRALETAPSDAQKLMAWKLPTLARWQMAGR